MEYKSNTAQILSISAIILTVINTILLVNICHYNKNNNNVNIIKCELIYISLLIAIIWSIYGFIESQLHTFFCNIIIILLLFYLLYLYYK
jgi:hypothetical protein